MQPLLESLRHLYHGHGFILCTLHWADSRLVMPSGGFLVFSLVLVIVYGQTVFVF